jgi:hypothetical protein
VLLCLECPSPDAATPDAVGVVDAVADAPPDAAPSPDAPPPPDASVAVPDAPSVDALSDVVPDRYNCANEVPPTCTDHSACAVCLPSATGTTWCCRSGYCRPAIDRSTCE